MTGLTLQQWKAVPEDILQILQTQMTEGVIINAHAAIDASSLVMAQSILDDFAWSYLKVCALIAPRTGAARSSVNRCS